MQDSRYALRDRIIVYCMVEVEDAYEETDRKPQELCRIWAGIAPTGGHMTTLPGDIDRAEVTHRVRVRRLALPEISTDMYFVVHGQRMDVRYWYPVYKRRGMMDVFCTLVQGDDGGAA